MCSHNVLATLSTGVIFKRLNMHNTWSMCLKAADKPTSTVNDPTAPQVNRGRSLSPVSWQFYDGTIEKIKLIKHQRFPPGCRTDVHNETYKL